MDHNPRSKPTRITEGPDCPADDALSPSLITSLALMLEHQERLERMTERLSFMAENALTPLDRRKVVDMIDTVDRCIQAITAFSFEQEP